MRFLQLSYVIDMKVLKLLHYPPRMLASLVLIKSTRSCNCCAHCENYAWRRRFGIPSHLVLQPPSYVFTLNLAAY